LCVVGITRLNTVDLRSCGDVDKPALDTPALDKNGVNR